MPANTVAFAAQVRRLAHGALMPVVFALLLWAATAAGEIPIPGTPVPVTLQTFVVMMAALTLSWRQAGTAVALYLAMGAAGLPVFAGGGSTMSLLGPSAGFLIGFLPGVIVTAMLRGRDRADGAAGTALAALRRFVAAMAGCVAVVYFFGFTFQSALTGVPFSTVAVASMGFVAGDLIKAAVAALAATGLLRLR